MGWESSGKGWNGMEWNGSGRRRRLTTGAAALLGLRELRLSHELGLVLAILDAERLRQDHFVPDDQRPRLGLGVCGWEVIGCQREPTAACVLYGQSSISLIGGSR